MINMRKTVSANSMELDFIKKFIQELTRADSRITCETTDEELEQQYHVLWHEKQVFVLNIDNIYTLKFERNSISATTSYRVLGTHLATGDISSAFTLTFSDTSVTISGLKPRSWSFRLVGNDRVLLIQMSSCNNKNAVLVPNLERISFRDGDVKAYASGGGVSTYLLEDGSYVNTYDRLNYLYDEADENHIEVIKNKVFTHNNLERVTTSDVFWDCSTLVREGVVHLIDGKPFFALSNHTLLAL